MKNKSNEIKIKADNWEEMQNELAVNLWTVTGKITIPDYTEDDTWSIEDYDLVDLLNGGGNGEYEFVGDYECKNAGSIWIERFRDCECVDASVEYTIYAIRGRRKDIIDDELAECGLVIGQRCDGGDGYIILHDDWDDADMDDVVSSIWWSPTEYTLSSCCDIEELSDDMGYYCVITTVEEKI